MKKLLILALMFVSTTVYATNNIVPRADDDGTNLGISSKRWSGISAVDATFTHIGRQTAGDATFTALNLANGYIRDINSRSFTILNPVDTDDYPLWKTSKNLTILSVSVQCLGGTDIVGMLDECDADGINCATVDASDITAAADNSVDDDGSLSNPSIDALDYVGWHTTSIDGEPTSTTVTFTYTVDQP